MYSHPGVRWLFLPLSAVFILPLMIMFMHELTGVFSHSLCGGFTHLFKGCLLNALEVGVYVWF